jgi:hypothetical protein
MEIEGADAGTFVLPANRSAWTDGQIVRVTDGWLTVRIHLKHDTTYAALSEVMFHFVDRREDAPR